MAHVKYIIDDVEHASASDAVVSLALRSLEVMDEAIGAMARDKYTPEFQALWRALYDYLKGDND